MINAADAAVRSRQQWRRPAFTGASKRNWASYGNAVSLPAGMPDWQRDLLADPQTSGGLLVSCAAKDAPAVLKSIFDAGYPAAKIVGHTEAGAPGVRVVA